MTIKKRPAPKNMREWTDIVTEHMVYDLDAKILGKERCLLCPQSEGRVSWWRWHGLGKGINWQVGAEAPPFFGTRAQAAQAAWEEGEKHYVHLVGGGPTLCKCGEKWPHAE